MSKKTCGSCIQHAPTGTPGECYCDSTKSVHSGDVTSNNFSCNDWEGERKPRQSVQKRLMEGVWSDKTAAEIAAELGVTSKIVSNQLYALKQKGIDVPHSKKKGPRPKAQQAEPEKAPAAEEGYIAIPEMKPPEWTPEETEQVKAYCEENGIDPHRVAGYKDPEPDYASKEFLAQATREIDCGISAGIQAETDTDSPVYQLAKQAGERAAAALATLNPPEHFVDANKKAEAAEPVTSTLEELNRKTGGTVETEPEKIFPAPCVVDEPEKEGYKVTRAECLDMAKGCVCGQREQDYGKPEDNFQRIANLWGAYQGCEYTAQDVAVMMALLKIARIGGENATADSFIDLAGYAACGCEIATGGKA